MIAQSLGGMEIVVGMSSLTGGLVLDKSELIQGSELPINYLFASTSMPLTSNVYHVGQGINTISQHDCHDRASSCINSHEPYPVLCTLVERLEELAGMLTNWMSGTTAIPSLDSPSPLIRTESSGWVI